MADGEGGGAEVLEAAGEELVEVKRACVAEGQRCWVLVRWARGVAAVWRARRNGTVAAARDAAPRVASAATASRRHAAQM